MPLLVLAITVWAGATLYTNAALPSLHDIRKARSEIREYDSLLAETGGHALLRESLQTINDTLASRHGLLAQGLGDADDLSGLLEMLIGWAKAADIRFVRVEPKPQVDEDGYTTFPVLLKFDCPYDAFGRFVANLESQPQVVRVERISIGAVSPHKVDVGLLVTLFLRQKQTGE